MSDLRREDLLTFDGPSVFGPVYRGVTPEELDAIARAEGYVRLWPPVNLKRDRARANYESDITEFRAAAKRLEYWLGRVQLYDRSGDWVVDTAYWNEDGSVKSEAL